MLKYSPLIPQCAKGYSGVLQFTILLKITENKNLVIVFTDSITSGEHRYYIEDGNDLENIWCHTEPFIKNNKRQIWSYQSGGGTWPPSAEISFFVPTKADIDLIKNFVPNYNNVKEIISHSKWEGTEETIYLENGGKFILPPNSCIVDKVGGMRKKLKFSKIKPSLKLISFSD